MSHKNKQKFSTAFSLSLAYFILNGCIQTPTIPTATKSQENLITVTPLPISTETQTPEPEMAREDTGYEGYYIGIVVITEYYTLLSTGLYEEAYNLLSDSEKAKYSFEDFAEANKGLPVKIVTIQPLKIWQLDQGISPLVFDQEDNISFIAEIATQSEGNEEVQSQFITVIKEVENWKIDSFATGLVIPTPNSSTVFPTLNPGTVPDRSYYDGIVVIAQFHALFNYGLYKDAYELLSPFRRNLQSLDEFISDIKTFGIIKRQIVSIRPFYEGTLQLQTFTTPDIDTRRMFYTEIYAEGKDGWAGSLPNGIHGYYITIILEKSNWKIYSINTVGLP